MRALMTIGRFAQLTGLTIKTLRRYDAQGVLTPAVVDLRTGYRLYHPDQVAVGERIRELRSLEMPLADIRALLAATEPAIVHDRLAEHRQRLESRINDYHQALTVLGHLDGSGSQEDRPMTHESTTYACSFCRKDRSQVERLIAGPDGVFICNECVALCNELIAKARHPEPPVGSPAATQE